MYTCIHVCYLKYVICNCYNHYISFKYNCRNYCIHCNLTLITFTQFLRLKFLTSLFSLFSNAGNHAFHFRECYQTSMFF